MAHRGVLIVFEGCDKAGKSTHVKLLMNALKNLGKKVTVVTFPDRATAIGQMIDQYLKCQSELPDESIHLLFSANRWELMPKIEKALFEGDCVIVDRYAFSGVSFTSAKGLSLSWCKAPDVGLPRPDIVIFLDVTNEVAARRNEFGEERYENIEFQKKVKRKFYELKDDTWKVVETSRPISDVHQDILSLALQTIETCQCKPIGRLWT